MAQCASHNDRPAIIYCPQHQNYYCSYCISMHNGHQGVMGIEQYNQTKKKEEREKEIQSKYNMLKITINVLSQLKTRTNAMLNAAIDKIKGQINYCKAHAAGKLIKPTKNMGSIKAKAMEMYDSLKKKVKEMVDLDVSAIILTLNKSVSEIYKSSMFEKSESQKDIIHSWKGNEIFIYNSKGEKISKIRVNTKIDGWADSISIEKRIFIMGGGGPIDTVYEADLKNKQLIEKQPMKCKKYWHTLCRLDTSIYNIGGYDENKSLNDCEKYDINSNQWKDLPLLNTPRCQCTAFTWGNCLYAFCGTNVCDSTDYFLNSLEKLKLCSSVGWSIIVVINPPSCRDNMHGISINDGVIVYGGYDGHPKYMHD